MTLRDALLKYRPHRRSATASLIDKLAAAPPGTDPWRLDLSKEEQATLGRVLTQDSHCPSAAEVELAVTDLTAKRLRAQAEDITQKIARYEEAGDGEAVADLLVLRKVVMRALEGLER